MSGNWRRIIFELSSSGIISLIKTRNSSFCSSGVNLLRKLVQKSLSSFPYDVYADAKQWTLVSEARKKKLTMEGRKRYNLARRRLEETREIHFQNCQRFQFWQKTYSGIVQICTHFRERKMI